MPDPGTNREIRFNDGHWQARNKFSGEWFNVGGMDMSKMELCKACGIRFPKADYPGRVWPHYTVEEMMSALLTGFCPKPKEIRIKDDNAPITDKQRHFLRNLNAKVRDWDQRMTSMPTTMGQAHNEIERLKEVIAHQDDPKPEPKPYTEPESYVPTTPVAEWTTPTEVIATDPELERRVNDLETSQTVQNDVIVRQDERISAIASLMNDLRPQVTEIHIPERETVTIEGRQHKVFPELLRLVGAGLNVMMVGPPGTGKSHMAEQVAKALSLEFGAESCDPTMSPTALFGYRDANGHIQTTPYRERFIHGGVMLLDEADKTHPGVAAKVNQGVANRVCAFPDGMHVAHKDWHILLACNTFATGATKAHQSAMAIDPATLDRFVVLFVGYDEALESELAHAEYDHADTTQWVAKVRQYRKNADEHGIREYFTPRASIDGAKMLKAGFTIDQVTAMRLDKGLTVDTVAKLNGWAY